MHAVKFPVGLAPSDVTQNTLNESISKISTASHIMVIRFPAEMPVVGKCAQGNESPEVIPGIIRTSMCVATSLIGV